MFFVIWVISPFKGCRCTLRNIILAFLCIKANLNIDLPVHAVAYGCIWRCPDSLQANYLVWSVCLMWKDSEEITSDEKTEFKRDKNINQAPGSPHVGQISAVRCMSSCTSTQSSNACLMASLIEDRHMKHCSRYTSQLSRKCVFLIPHVHSSMWKGGRH